MIKGVGIQAGFDIVEVPGTNGWFDTDLAAKFSYGADAFKQGYDFGFIHIKAVDVAGHEKSADLKMEMLEKADRELEKFLEAMREEELLVCVTGDHSTPIRVGDHTH